MVNKSLSNKKTDINRKGIVNLEQGFSCLLGFLPFWGRVENET